MEMTQHLSSTSSRPLLLLILLSLCGCDTPDKTSSNMGKLLGQDQSGYGQVINNDSIRFPRDHLAHDDYKIEWWYLTANLETESGEPLGLQWTQFRIAMAPPIKENKNGKTVSDASNQWASQQLFMAHAAITTESQHFTQEKWSRAHPSLARVQVSPLAIYLDNWRWQSSNSESLFPATLSVASSASTAKGSDAFSYRLKLSTHSPYQRQGDNGYSIKSADGEVASYYYSQPFIDITGEVEIQGQRLKVSGKGWLDREWSSQFLKQEQQGWDWFALRLDDDSTLMLFQLRGEQSSKTANFYSARRMFKDGSGYNLSSNAIKVRATQWQEIGNNTYPVSWQIQIPEEKIDLQLNALNPNAKMALTTQYWEGPIMISGSHQGEGYMELTGYE